MILPFFAFYLRINEEFTILVDFAFLRSVFMMFVCFRELFLALTL